MSVFLFLWSFLISTSTYRFTLLCMSLSALFEVQNTHITNPPTPSDFLRSLLGTLNEFEQFIGSGAEKAGVGMMMGLGDTEGRGKMVREPF